METDYIVDKLSILIENLGFDYDRLSRSGQEVYDEICLLIGLLKEG